MGTEFVGPDIQVFTAKGGGAEASAAAANPPYTWPNIAIVNDQSSGVSDADALAMAKACAHQVLYDFGPAWHIGAHINFTRQGSKPPAGMWVLALLDSSDVAGALGYHDLTPDGLPLGKVFAGTDRQYGQKVGVTLSHELLEMLGDPWINLTAQADSGPFYAWEACDAVEADNLGYDIDGVPVSDFVTPAWFGHGAGPVDFKGHISRAFELAPGGYISEFDPATGAGWTQVTAQHPAEMPAEEAILAVPRVGSRRERRFRGRGFWVPSTYEQE